MITLSNIKKTLTGRPLLLYDNQNTAGVDEGSVFVFATRENVWKLSAFVLSVNLMLGKQSSEEKIRIG